MSDSTEKTILKIPGRWCALHNCDFITDADEDGRFHWLTKWYCNPCAIIQCEHEDKQRLEERRLERLRLLSGKQTRAGIPKRFLSASLDNFIAETGPQQEVLAVLRQFIATVGQDPSSLVLIGNLGTGKSFCGYALITAWLQMERDALFLTAVGLIRKIRETWRGTGETEGIVVHKFATIKLLVVDEVGVQNCSENEMTILTDILNQRYENMLPTVVIGNLTITELVTILGERAIDRLREGGRVLSFTWNSRRKV